MKYINEDGREVVIGGSQGNDSIQLNYPQSIDFDLEGNLYVADSNNNRIQRKQEVPELTISAGDVSGSITVNALADGSYEGDEIATFKPATPVNVNNSFTDEINITIIDSDSPELSYEFSSETIDENSENMSLDYFFVFSFWKDTTIPFTVSGTATVDEEFTISTSPVVIPAGKEYGTIIISTKDLDDDIVETKESIIINIENVVNATTETESLTLYLLSDDNPSISSFNVDINSLPEDGSESATLTVEINSASSKDVTIPLNLKGSAVLYNDYDTSFDSQPN